MLSTLSPTSLRVIAVLLGAAPALILAARVIYRLRFHPLAQFQGPWYAAATSLTLAALSLVRLDIVWIEYLVKKYGRRHPIRIQPNLLLFPHPSALKEIYCDPKCNTKSSMYGTGVFGPPHLFSTLDGDKHRELRKSLGGAPWTIGSLKNNWEPRFDDHVLLLCQKLKENADANEPVILCDRVAQFAADIVTMLLFTEPFGFVRNARDERRILETWRQSLNIFAFASRFNFFHYYLARIPGFSTLFFPKKTDVYGMGWLMGESERQVNERQALVQRGLAPKIPDFLQHCLDARLDKKPLSQSQKEAHVTLFVQAGSDTTATALGSTLRFLIVHSEKLGRATQEINQAYRSGLLSTPVKYEETRQHLPYIAACIKEALRLQPPATNLFGRVVPKGGKIIGGHYIPPGVEITSTACVVQRDPEVFHPDPHLFRPERWLDRNKAAEMDTAIFSFGIGPRTCLGRDIAHMELYKVIPELIRRFHFDLVEPGEYLVVSGVGYNINLTVNLTPRL
ncbi:hypothetical protein GX48_05811 [Paracoccidioides brasiliensis]|nr:hypothetical protein GX48_05811 [Paracoccidioides brasiliensis]